MMGRLYAAARLYVNFFQPSFKLKEKRREGAKVIKRYHLPSTLYERALTHPKVTAAVKKRLRERLVAQGPARRRHDRCPIARGCGRLGLCGARPAHSPSRRASRGSHLARPINRHRIVVGNGAIRVTFADAAIRGSILQAE
jgi:hypothetical protein